MRLAYRAAYVALRIGSLVLHPRTRGVKCVLLDEDGRAVFVRHTYGDRRCWELPGGGARRGESAPAAARREAWEELGVDVAEWRELGSVRGEWYAKVEDLVVLAAPAPRAPLRPDPVEIATVARFPPGEPPHPVGRTTAAALPLVLRGLRHD